MGLAVLWSLGAAGRPDRAAAQTEPSQAPPARPAAPSLRAESDRGEGNEHHDSESRATATVRTRDAGFEIDVRADQVDVLLDGALFTSYQYKSYARPILYPLCAPGGVGLTRNYPMRKGVLGEAEDHPHHKSVWFAHGSVDGVDFWSEKGQIVVDRIDRTPADSPEAPGFTAQSRWLDDQRLVCREAATLRFAAQEDARWIDFCFSLSSDRDLVWGDTKEGTFAIRTHPQLQLAPAQADQPVGQARNSEGLAGAAIWGRRARWVDYQGTIEGTPYGIALFDHPLNLRHPTTWHARDYGLVAANPFGLHDFLGEPAGAGDFVLQAGQVLALRYRLVVYRGERSVDELEQWFADFSTWNATPLARENMP